LVPEKLISLGFLTIFGAKLFAQGNKALLSGILRVFSLPCRPSSDLAVAIDHRRLVTPSARRSAQTQTERDEASELGKRGMVGGVAGWSPLRT